MNTIKNIYEQRKIKNYLLQPLLQIKLGLYIIIFTTIFFIIFVGVIAYNFQELFNIILDSVTHTESVLHPINQKLHGISGWLVFLMAIYWLAVLIIVIIYTHKLIGPMIAFRKHIYELIKGNYQSRINLRKKDAFWEVAEDLNLLAQTLEEKNFSNNL